MRRGGIGKGDEGGCAKTKRRVDRPESSIPRFRQKQKRAHMKPNMAKTIVARNWSLVKMSAGASDVIWLALAMLRCGFTCPLKSVR